ncbi:hypothetical protein TNCT_237831 [Trichonephila clavata]|uniref:Uncharacterized protein n=1 Tax=Trichonephila clavata TaxID=2740835 RepID=A0A8X6KYJ7_TRICU|nr:hypothetical protein TNCT_237831 [Trichonephila clavata]
MKNRPPYNKKLETAKNTSGNLRMYRFASKRDIDGRPVQFLYLVEFYPAKLNPSELYNFKVISRFQLLRKGDVSIFKKVCKSA